MIYPRPKLTIFAETAKTGEVVNFPDWARGWGITLEQTNAKPPMEWMNDALKQLNTHSLYLLQNGGYEWDKALEYPIGAKVQINNLIYIAKVKNTNVNPAGNAATWAVYGLQQSDISQILNGTSKTKVASEDALRRVNLTAEKGVSDAKVAKDKADLVGIQANQNTGNLNNKVDKSGDVMSGQLEIRMPIPGLNLTDSRVAGVGRTFYITNQRGELWLVARKEKGENSEQVIVKLGTSAAGTLALTSQVLGLEQGWKVMTESRRTGVTYTNTTKNTIEVIITKADDRQGGNVRVNGVSVGYLTSGAYSTGITFAVPPDGTYMTESSVLQWSELR